MEGDLKIRVQFTGNQCRELTTPFNMTYRTTFWEKLKNTSIWYLCGGNIVCWLFLSVIDMLVVVCLPVGTSALFARSYQILQQYSRKWWWTETKNWRYVSGQIKTCMLYSAAPSVSTDTHYTVVFFRPQREVCTRRCQNSLNPAKLRLSPKTASSSKTPDMFTSGEAGLPRWANSAGLFYTEKLCFTCGWKFQVNCTFDRCGQEWALSHLYCTDLRTILYRCCQVRLSATRGRWKQDWFFPVSAVHVKEITRE